MSDNNVINPQNPEKNKKNLAKIYEMVKKNYAEWGGEKLLDREPVGYNTGTRLISQIIEENRE
jgi:hypothetical protein